MYLINLFQFLLVNLSLYHLFIFMCNNLTIITPFKKKKKGSCTEIGYKFSSKI